MSYAKPQLRSADTENAVALVRGNNIQRSRVNLDDLTYVDRACVKADQMLRARDIVLTMSSGSVALIGKSGWIEHTPNHMTFGAFCGVVRSSRVDARWLYWFMQTDHYRRTIRELAKGTNINNLKREHLVELAVPMPSREAQGRIHARIDELFAEIDDGDAHLARARADLGTWRKALLKAAVTGELTADWRAANPAVETGPALLARILAQRRTRWHAAPRNKGKTYVEPAGPDGEALPQLSPGWTWATLAQVAFVSGGLTVDAKRKPADPVDVPYLRVANVQRGHLDLRVVKRVVLEAAAVAALRVEPGDILLNEGGDRDKIGRGWVFEGQIENCVHQNHVFKARPVSELVSPYLVSMYMNELGRRFFIDEGKQTTNLASISLSKVSRAPVPVPPSNEAAAILAALGDPAASDMEGDLHLMDEASATLRQAILAAAFSGKLVR